MDFHRRMAVIVLISLALASPAMADEPLPADRREGDMVLDLIIARPIGLLSIAAGSALFVVSLPFTLPSGSTDAAAGELVRKPVYYTFKRPLGQLGQ